MPANAPSIVNKVWNYAHVLRDDGVSYGDYVEQITYLLFLKMAHEGRTLLHEESPVPPGYNWESLAGKDGDELEVHYRHVLEELGRQPGMLGTIFRKAQNKIQDPAKLKRLISLMGEETWLALDTDVKGDIYEGLLERNAADVKSGAGQYFTPRPLIEAIVQAMRPGPETEICDPACGTGGFLLAAHDHVQDNYQLDRDQKRFLRDDALRGVDIVDGVVRLCAMNLYLRGIGGEESPVAADDALRSLGSERFDMVLTNPPFGKKSSYTVLGADGKATSESQTYERDDFWATTSNKQLNFLQHVKSLLKIGGTAAVVVPDNVLFFGRKPASETPWTHKLWIYDLRTNQHFTLKQNTLSTQALQDFVTSYNADNRQGREETERFRAFSYEELVSRDKANLDIFWLRDESLEGSEDLQPPDVIAVEIAENLKAALEQFAEIHET
ncbi:class I SAM-dependent DNA methyltransferase [soil metagenome]